MAARELIRGYVTLALIAGALTLGVVMPASARAGNCCQCPLPTCGPPNNGHCGTGCTPVPNARCDGHTGRCKTLTARDRSRDDTFDFAGWIANQRLACGDDENTDRGK